MFSYKSPKVHLWCPVMLPSSVDLCCPVLLPSSVDLWCPVLLIYVAQFCWSVLPSSVDLWCPVLLPSSVDLWCPVLLPSSVDLWCPVLLICVAQFCWSMMPSCGSTPGAHWGCGDWRTRGTRLQHGLQCSEWVKHTHMLELYHMLEGYWFWFFTYPATV